MGISTPLREQAERIFELIDDERHLAAHELLVKVQERLVEKSSTTRSSFRKNWKRKDSKRANLKEMEEVKQLLAQRASTISTLQKRCKLFRQALHNVDDTNEEWTMASAHFGIQTYYRREADGSLSVKLEGELKDAPLFEQVCVLREFDLHSKWSPCCTSSQTISNLGKLDTVGWFLIGLPSFGIARDGCVRVIGCDHSVEEGKVIVTGQGVQDLPPGATHPPDADTQLLDDPVLDTLDIPPIPTKKGTGRMTIRTLQAVIEVTSPTSATTKLVANMDPNVSILPNCLLELAMKNIAGLVLLKMQGAARRVPRDPVANPHARRIRQDRTFYEDWLMPKCQRLCESRGWAMTPVHYFDEPATERSEQRPHHDQQEISRQQQPWTRGEQLPHTNNNSSSMVGPPSFDGGETSTLNTGTSSGTVEEGDTVSELSKDSALRNLLRNHHNPLAKFLLEQERKARARKAVDHTQRSCERLRARTLSGAEEVRVQALQQAKARRQQQQQQPSMRLWRSMQHHSTLTRVVVMTGLMTWLMLALYPSLVWGASSSKPWSTVLSADTEAILSIFLCAIPHFLLCDVTFLYAFDGLELGTKAGAKAKAYYSDTVRYCMMIVSLGAAAFSVVQAIIKVGIRQLIDRIAASTTSWEGLTSFVRRQLAPTSDISTSWTDDAYCTARALFFYSSICLVYCVILFYLWLRAARRRKTESSSIPKTITMTTTTPSSASTAVSDS